MARPLRRLISRVLVPLMFCVAGCGANEPSAEPAPASASASASPAACATCVFEDATPGSGIAFVHRQSHAGAVKFLPETIGPGVAALDYDGDGQLDLYFVQGSGDGDAAAGGVTSQLYRRSGAGLRHEEVGRAAGVGVTGYGQSALALDFDNDGYEDLLVTFYREETRLFRNNGDGTFVAVPLPGARADRLGWQSFATALDYDRDGLLDLYLGRYLDFGPEHFLDKPKMVFHEMGTFPETMLPGPYAPMPKVLMQNDGRGGFTDVTLAAGAGNPGGKGMTALAGDLDDDGWPDLFVANDVTPCALLRNQQDGTFQDVSKGAWVAEVRGSMGVALGYRRKTWNPYLVVTHWTGDVPAVYERISRPGQKLRFADVAEVAGLGRCPRSYVGWGVEVLDVANDGGDGLFIVNGHTNHGADDTRRLAPQQALLFRGQESRFEMEPLAGDSDPMARLRVGRAAVVADLDHDGFADVVLGSNNQAAEVLRNRGGAGAWVGAQLVGTGSNRDALNARVELLAQDGSVARVLQVVSGDSFYTSSSRRIVFGLGASPGPVALRVRWLSGRQEEFAALPAGRYHRLVEGQGRAAR